MKTNKQLEAQDGIIIGNIEDKSSLSNPISRYLVQGFDHSLLELVEMADPASIHEVGCGEGRVLNLIRDHFEKDISLTGSDFSEQIISHLQKRGNPEITYKNKSIYKLEPDTDSAELIMCCEVLEHLEDPEKALESLKTLDAESYIFSVPREPLWRILNMVRGKYWRDWGNTPGHLNHWSRRSFLAFLRQFDFKPVAIQSPLPWTMVCGHFKPPGSGTY